MIRLKESNQLQWMGRTQNDDLLQSFRNHSIRSSLPGSTDWRRNNLAYQQFPGVRTGKKIPDYLHLYLKNYFDYKLTVHLLSEDQNRFVNSIESQSKYFCYHCWKRSRRGNPVPRSFDLKSHRYFHHALMLEKSQQFSSEPSGFRSPCQKKT